MKQKGADHDRIRISIAFLDLAHKHGENGKVFERKSISSVCPECQRHVGEKIYVDGYLVHLALTRVPVNPRTIMEPEDIMAKKSITTRKEDAVSIVGDSTLVEEIEKAALETKSDVLVEMSEVEGSISRGEVDVSTLPSGYVEALVEEAKTKKDTEEVSAKDKHEADMEDDMDGEDYKDKKKKAKMSKSITAEEVAEIVKSVFAELSVKDEIPSMAEKSDTVSPVQDKSALDIATDELYNSINGAIQMQGATVEQRLEAINPALQNLGVSITAVVRESMGVTHPAPVANDQAIVLEAITSVANSVKELAQEVAVLKAQTPSAPVTPQNRVPAPRSIQQAVISQSQAVVAPVNVMSVKNIVRRSVSSQLPPVAG